MLVCGNQSLLCSSGRLEVVRISRASRCGDQRPLFLHASRKGRASPGVLFSFGCVKGVMDSAIGSMVPFTAQALCWFRGGLCRPWLPHLVSYLSPVSVCFLSESFQSYLASPYMSPPPAKSGSDYVQLLYKFYIKLLRKDTGNRQHPNSYVNPSWLAVAVWRVLMILNSPMSTMGKSNGTAW